MKYILPPEIDDYASEVTSSPPELLRELQKETERSTDMPQMLTGPVEGRFLKLFVKALSARRVLEIGTFTGYASLSMAEALPEDGRLVTCEIDQRHADIARKYFDASPHGRKIELKMGPAIDTLEKLIPPFDFVFIDADKINYAKYYEESIRLLRAGGYVAIDNALWSGEVLDPKDDVTRVIDSLNRKIALDSRVESVLLTIRDGIHLVRKK